MQKINELKQHFPSVGRVEWLAIRPQKGKPVTELTKVEAVIDHGLLGDKAGQRPGGKRQVTLIQAEYLPLIQSLLSDVGISFLELRRNIAVSGINLNALKDHVIQIGRATFEVTGYCHPCSKLEQQLGYGAFNALRGHGGLTAKVIVSGNIKLGDEVRVIIET